MRQHNNTKKRRGPNLPGLLRVDEAGERLGVTEGTVRNWLWQRRLPYVKVGTATRIRVEAVDALVREVRAERPWSLDVSE